MNLINPHSYNHIWPRTPEPDVTIWTCTRCGGSEVFYATQLTAGNGLTDLLTWATGHTGSDCIPEPPPRPIIPDHRKEHQATSLLSAWGNDGNRPPQHGSNYGHDYDHQARCKNCGVPFEDITQPCPGGTG